MCAASLIANDGNVGLSAPINVSLTGAASETITWLHNDLGGNTIMATDSLGGTLWKENFTPFGDRVIKDATATSNNRQWFAGKPQDSETGLSYFGARYYDPAVGRFMGIDAARFSEGNLHSFNRYAYGNNNPLRFIDPDGNEGKLIINSSGNGGSFMSDGHAWVSYTPDSGPTTTYGTWGNNPSGLGNGLHTNLESGRVGDASRSIHLNDNQERKFIDKVKEYQAKGGDAWKLGEPCSTFAGDAWQAGTGEKLDTKWGPISNPTTLKESIVKQNNGAKHSDVKSPETANSMKSSTGPSSSSASSGSSINQSGSSF